MTAPLVAALLLAGCTGPGGDPREESRPGGSALPSGAAGPLEVVGVWTGREQASFEAVLAAFTRASGVPVRYRSTGDDPASALDAQLEKGEPPDVALLPQRGLLRDLAARRRLVPLAGAAQAAVAEHHDPYWQALGTEAGQQYGVVFKVAHKSVWWYDVAALRRASVRPPATWPELLAAAAPVRASGRDLAAVGGADGWPLTDLVENLLLAAAGPAAYDRLERGEEAWTAAAPVAALGELARLAGTPGALVGGRRGVLEDDFPSSVAEVFGPRPRAATVFEGDFVVGVVDDLAPRAVLGRDYDFFPFPRTATAGARPVVVGADIGVALTDRPQAQELLAFLAGPEAARVWAGRGGFLTPVTALPGSAYRDDVQRRLDVLVDAALAAGALRYDLSDAAPPRFGATPGAGLYRLLQEVVAGRPVAQVARALEEEATAARRTF